MTTQDTSEKEIDQHFQSVPQLLDLSHPAKVSLPD